MHIKKLKLKNFKRFDNQLFDFNDDVNIVVGDNESGKSTLLEAIEICLNFTYRGKPLSSELTTDLFNNDCINQYLAGNKSQETLPELLIEAYLDGNPKLKGDNNSEKEDVEGIFVRIYFDTELSDSYATFKKEPDKVSTLPVEFYTIDWYSFGWNRLTHHNKNINCLFVDPTRLHPTYGRAKYINNIINAALEKKSRSTLNLNYRQLKAKFDDEADVIEINNKIDADNEISNKSLKITADIATNTSWESGLQLAVDNISFNQIGKGEQSQIQIKLALQNKAQDVDIVMLEEPENHLSHINLVQLISYIENKHGKKQVFLSTHSSYVLNKLSFDKLCLLSDRYIRLKEVESGTVKTLARLPGYDTLRAVLAKKIVLVEGPSDELVLKKIYLEKYNCLPEENGIDIIVVRGIGFKNYINIVKPLRHPIRVVKDNDGSFQENILEWSKDYKEYDFIKFFSPESAEQYSLEPALVEANGDTEESLDLLANVMLSKQTYNKYNGRTGLAEKKAFFKDWYSDEKSGSKKVDSAIRIFDTNHDIKFPEYLEKAIDFDA
jgi:predicted ATP-dependent endonuclease of OLD family